MRTGSQMKLITILAASAMVGCFDSTNNDNGGSGITAQYYVAVGNSLTAGFESNGLRADWQKESYPALIAKQMGVDADFQLPLVDSPGIGGKVNGKITEPLTLDSTGSAIAATKFLAVDPATLLSNKTLNRPYNDLAVPGCTTHDFIFASDSSTSQGNNGLFNIILRPGLEGGLSMMRQAILLQPTVLTIWIGNNDILGGITSGTVIEGTTVTPVAAYKQMMDLALDTLLRETQAHIFLANIPSIPTIPFVTTIPTWIFKPDFTPAVDTSTKFLTEESNVKYILLPALSYIQGSKMGVPAALGGSDVKIPASLTLTEEEAATATTLVEGYNAYLKAKCDANPTRLTLVDINALLEKLLKGEIAGLTGTFPLLDPAHSAFSLDGVHPNAKGYQQVANVYIDAINSALGKNYSHVGG